MVCGVVCRGQSFAGGGHGQDGDRALAGLGVAHGFGQHVAGLVGILDADDVSATGGSRCRATMTEHLAWAAILSARGLREKNFLSPVMGSGDAPTMTMSALNRSASSVTAVVTSEAVRSRREMVPPQGLTYSRTYSPAGSPDSSRCFHSWLVPGFDLAQLHQDVATAFELAQAGQLQPPVQDVFAGHADFQAAGVEAAVQGPDVRAGRCGHRSAC